MYILHVYASQLNLNYSGVVDDQMMVLVVILQESKVVSHCDLLSDVREVIVQRENCDNDSVGHIVTML